MSLDFNLKNCKPVAHEKAWDENDRSTPIIFALSFGGMAIEMGSITEKNWREFYTRLNALERATGAFQVNADGPVYVTPQDVYDFIGLTLNVITKNTPAKVKNDIYAHLKGKAEQDLKEFDKNQVSA